MSGQLSVNDDIRHGTTKLFTMWQ